MDNPLKGLRLILCLRCSTKEQIEASLPEQRHSCLYFAEQNGIEIVDTVELGGYSATTGSQVEPLKAIIRRKIRGEKFDGLFFDCFDRFVRSDVDRGDFYKMLMDTDSCLVTVKEGLMTGTETASMQWFMATSRSEGYTRDQSRNLSRHLVQCIQNKVFPPCLTFPYGLDRVYYDATGTRTFRVRLLPDGRKEVMDADPPCALRYFIPRKVKRLGLLEKDWRYEFEPGDPATASVVQEIWTHKYRDGWSKYKITADLNARGIQSPRGRALWPIASVRNLLNNPVYLGYSVGFVRSCGAHSGRRKGAPIMYPVQRRPGYRQDGRGERKKIPVKFNSPSEWMISEQPALRNFLPPDVRESGLKDFERKQREGWKRSERRCTGKWSESYFLSGILLDRATGVPMVGTSGGSATQRYYRDRSAQYAPKAGRVTSRCRAEAVEEAVKRAMQIVLENFSVSESSIRKLVEETLRTQATGHLETSSLAREKADLEQQYKNIVMFAQSERGKELLAEETRRIEVRLNEIDRRLLAAAQECVVGKDPDSIVEELKSQFPKLEALLQAAAPRILRNLAKVFVSKLTYDQEQRCLELELALPSWAINQGDKLAKIIGTQETSGSTSTLCTTSDNHAILLKSVGQVHSRPPRMPTVTWEIEWPIAS